ncbi:hypothetical protein WKU33_16950 [Oceanobacillus sp. HCA-5259]|uniref:hypothetical protein n=1 Tax=Oceanobacillus sp. HCA-5259 TaxID=3134661 RepID=UPI0030C48C33
MKSFMSFFLSFFIFNSKIIEYFLPFSTYMTSYKKKKSVIYLLYLITLKLSVTVLAWYLVTVPFLEAYYHGYFSFYFRFIGIPVGILAIIAIFFTYSYLMHKKFMVRDRSVSVTSLLFNNWIKTFLKVIYWQFFIATFFMMFTKNMPELNSIGLETLEKHSFLNLFTLFAISIIYAFTNKYFEIKVHQYFYYFFDLWLNIEEYENRIKELSKDFSILFTKFDNHMYRSHRNLARDSRVIVLRHKYIPISFTLTYYAVDFERHYYAVYQEEYAAGIRPSYHKNVKESNIFPRTRIIQKYYPEKIKKRVREGRRKTSVPIGKILIIGRVITVLLVIALVLSVNHTFTWEDFLEHRKSNYLGIAFLLVILLITYLFAWFYTNIAISVGMFFIIKEADYYAEEPINLLILIAVTIVFNLMAMSFWKEEKIKELLYLR